MVQVYRGLPQCQAIWYKGQMEKPTEIDKMRSDLIKLRNLRDSMILELGEYAQENNDLRENSAYLHTEQKIHLIDAQIDRILAVFSRIELDKKKAKHRRVDL